MNIPLGNAFSLFSSHLTMRGKILKMARYFINNPENSDYCLSFLPIKI